MKSSPSRLLFRSHLIMALVGALLLSACHTVPETGRRSFVALPESFEISLGAQSFEGMKSEMEVVTTGPQAEMVERVGQRIAQVATTMPGAQWEFVLFKDDNINAFALPGGKVGIFTGLFKAVEQEDDLAIVVAHEIGHVVARHGGSRMSTALAIAAGGVAVGVATSDLSSEQQTAWLIAYGGATTLGVLLPYSRSQEIEADHIGLIYAARAGYDPRVAVSFWQRMDRLSGGSSVPEFVSTHPSSETRIEAMKKLMPQAIEEYRKARPDLFSTGR